MDICAECAEKKVICAKKVRAESHAPIFQKSFAPKSFAPIPPQQWNFSFAITNGKRSHAQSCPRARSEEETDAEHKEQEAIEGRSPKFNGVNNSTEGTSSDFLGMENQSHTNTQIMWLSIAIWLFSIIISFASVRTGNIYQCAT